jgi:3-oxoacyl-(acyl-carrier-protein) synthase
MREQRVVVTGLGVVTPIGIGVPEFWEALKTGRNGVAEVTHFDPASFPSRMAAEVKGFDPGRWLDRKSAGQMDRFAQFSLAAAGMAIEDAGLSSRSFDPNRAGVIIGSGSGGSETIERGYDRLKSLGPRSMNLQTLWRWIPKISATSGMVNHLLLKGFIWVIAITSFISIVAVCLWLPPRWGMIHTCPNITPTFPCWEPLNLSGHRQN